MSQELCLCRSLFAMKSVWFQVPGASHHYFYLWPKPAFSVPSQPTLPPSCPCPRPLFCMLGWSYFEISPGPVCHSVTFLITSEGCCAWHGNEALFVSAAALLSVCPISSCSLGARIVWPSPGGPLRVNNSPITRVSFKAVTSVSGFKLLCLLCFFFSQHTKTIYEHRSRALPVWPVCVCPIIMPMYTASWIFTKEAELSDTHLNLF